VPTSASWDRGRDARAVGPARGTHAAVICGTLDPDLDAKSNQDLKRLAATSKPDRVIYCSSQKLSEHQLDKVATGIRVLLPPGASVTTLSSRFVARGAEAFPLADSNAARQVLLRDPRDRRLFSRVTCGAGGRCTIRRRQITRPSSDLFDWVTTTASMRDNAPESGSDDLDDHGRGDRHPMSIPRLNPTRMSVSPNIGSADGDCSGRARAAWMAPTPTMRRPPVQHVVC
jgi:hypothetical protein